MTRDERITLPSYALCVALIRYVPLPALKETLTVEEITDDKYSEADLTVVQPEPVHFCNSKRAPNLLHVLLAYVIAVPVIVELLTAMELEALVMISPD
ncbi:MAG: hypothetical protein HDQ87_04450 [Clostridia bacterium]|nr:hypothetical protein [Clostridia bacterium]MBD5559597.1 hypothetical protein [Clostridia bacterium]